MSSMTQHFGDVEALPLLDTAMLDGLRAALGPATDTLVEKALDVLGDRLGKLDALAGTPLDEGFARLAHEIGGVAGQIGLSRLSKASLALEQLSRGGDADGASVALGGLQHIAADSRAALGKP